MDLRKVTRSRNWLNSGRTQAGDPCGGSREGTSASSGAFPSSRRRPMSGSMNWRSRTYPTIRDFVDCSLSSRATLRAPFWEVKRNGEGRITEIRHRKTWPFVRHFFFHVIDREWGHVTIRMCSYPPFGAQVILNGHEWVERQARRKRVARTGRVVGHTCGHDEQTNRPVKRRHRRRPLFQTKIFPINLSTKRLSKNVHN